MDYESFFSKSNFNFIKEPENSNSNYWLNTILVKDKKQRDLFLKETNSNGIGTRPLWTLMHKSSLYKDSQSGSVSNAEWLENRAINLPSSVII